MSNSLRLYYFDIETFPNCFLFTGKFEGEQEYQVFEISDRVNERSHLLSWLSYIQSSESYMVGYNSLGFDYPILHNLLTSPHTFDAAKAHHLGSQIISSGDYGFEQIWLKDRIIPQIDLVKINHFDNRAKRTSLKSLQFAMRSESVEDLPFEVRNLNFEEMDILRKYNLHDVTETEKFGNKCRHAITMRKELLDQGVLTGDVLNYSDVKIGTEYLVKKIGRQKCYNGSKPRQSIRSEIRFKDIILPKVYYRTEEFNEVLNWFNSQIIYPGSEAPTPKLETRLSNLQFHFGVGGVHASVENRRYESDQDFVIKDIDVSGMYVAVAIANGFFPEHLGQTFVTAYKQLQHDRKQYPKGSFMNLVLKLAGNGVFGNSNNTYSPFYDPKYTFSVTINGQLQLLQLAEILSLIPRIELIQANTDGITAFLPREMEHLFNLWCREWEFETGLKLEHADYSKMFIRDVNNYIAVDIKGIVKRKGAYWYPITDDDYFGSSGSNWNKDFSNLTAQKGVENVLLTGCKPEEIIRLFSDPFDFMLRYKTPAGAKVFIGDEPQLKTVRYYVSVSGKPMRKVSQPKGPIGGWKRRNGISDADYKRILGEIPAGAWDERIHTKNKSKYQEVVTSIESGRLVKACNNMNDFSWDDVDFKYYEEEIRKLIIGET
jgi:hypothetical protein